MAVKRFAFIVLVLAGFCHTKIIPIVREGFEFCAEPENRAGKFDYSNLEIIAETDEDVYLNGSILFLKEVKAPWKALFFLEKFHRDKWNMEMIKKSVPDFCATIQQPSEPWYSITSKFEHKNCPFPAGNVINFNMQPLMEWPVMLPPTMIGKWRLTIQGEFDDEGGKKECFRAYFDLMEA